jgi:hypothetical protein
MSVCRSAFAPPDAYVASARRGEGIGGKLLEHLLQITAGPILVGTWAAAEWAVRFYERHGFRRVTSVAKDRLLRCNQPRSSAWRRLPQLPRVLGVGADLVKAPGEHPDDDAIGWLDVLEGESKGRPHGLLIRA